MQRVTVNAVYFFDPGFMDRISRAGEMFQRGQKVRVINLHGCPPANTMGQCYIVAADAPKDKMNGYQRAPFAMVSVQSLEKEMPEAVVNWFCVNPKCDDGTSAERLSRIETKEFRRCARCEASMLYGCVRP